jgi:Na+/H+-dicarboxylate symporter
LATIGGVLAGISLGIGLKYGLKDRDPVMTPREIGYLKMPGEIFLRTLKMLILPLIFSSLVNSLANLDAGTAGRLGLIACIYYLITIVMAVFTGIVLVLVIKPGSYGTIPNNVVDNGMSCKGLLPIDTVLDLIRNIFPENIIEATFRSTGSCVKYTMKIDENTTKPLTFEQYSNLSMELRDQVIEEPHTVVKDGMNVLGIIIFALVFGAIIGRSGEKAEALKNVIQGLEHVTMQMVRLVIWFSPIGIMFLIAAQIVAMNDLIKELERLGMYMVTVLTGLFIHGCITLQVLLVVFGRRNPLKWAYGLMQALLTAFGTASSNATLPLTLKCLEDNNDIDKRVTKFVVPLGATVNMNGTALYEAVAAIYIAQCLGVSLSIGQVILISLTSVLASVGAAGIPQAGLVTMIMVLIAANLPPEYSALIIPVDWLLDRFRTMVNVFDDTVGCAIVQNLCKKQLSESNGNMGNDTEMNSAQSMEKGEIKMRPAEPATVTRITIEHA